MNILKTISLAAALLWCIGLPPALSAAGQTDPSARLLRDASLMLLKEGNARFAAGKPQYPNQDAERRAATATQGQEPFATILACSDSRGPVELIFDRGAGDLFVARVAGNVAGVSELATVEYGVGHLSTPLLIVMGHTKCGAVTAVVKETELPGHLHSLAEKIKPAVARVMAETPEAEEAVPKAIQANVWQTIEDIIKQSSVVRAKVEAGQVTVLGAIYDLEQGKVTWLGAHPAQESLIALAAQAETDAALARKLASPGSAEKSSIPSRQAPAVPVAKTDEHGHSGHGAAPQSGGPKPH